jgi:hypothetical protein
MTTSGIEPATFRFVAQNLNHCATAVLYIYIYIGNVRITGNKTRSRNYCCRRETIIVTYPECVSVASGTQHIKRVCRVISLSLFRLAVQYVHYLSTLSHKRNDFRGKNIIEHKMCVLISSPRIYLEYFLL